MNKETAKWKGKFLFEMTRDELITALIELAELNRKVGQEYLEDIENLFTIKGTR